MGKKRTALAAMIDRELEDGETLDVEPQYKAPTVAYLGHRHHSLARMIAEGLTNEEISLALGYDPCRVSLLRNSPAMQDLIEFYRHTKEAREATVEDKLEQAAHLALETIINRVENTPDEVSTNALVEISKMTLDRTGRGPSSTTVVAVGSLAERLSAARRRVQTIDVTPMEVDDGPEA